MTDKTERFRVVRPRIKGIVDGTFGGEEKLSAICEALRDGVRYYD